MAYLLKYFRRYGHEMDEYKGNINKISLFLYWYCTYIPHGSKKMVTNLNNFNEILLFLYWYCTYTPHSLFIKVLETSWVPYRGSWDHIAVRVK